LFTTNPTLTEPGSNPGSRGERLATNRLSHGMAQNTGLLLMSVYVTSRIKALLGKLIFV
jgi:hypothetical protein